MDTLYKFSDWSSISEMKNSSKLRENCDLRVKVRVLINIDREVEGYQITIYHSISQVTVYQFYIEYGSTNVWSLTYDEAIAVLNKVGFSCQYIKKSYCLTDKMMDTLRSLKNLGYTHIWRTTDLRVLVSGEDPSKPHELKHLVDKLRYGYNYHNFTYLDFIPSTIDGIIEGNVYK